MLNVFTAMFDFISGYVSAFSVSCFERATCMTNKTFGAAIAFKYVYTCECIHTHTLAILTSLLFQSL